MSTRFDPSCAARSAISLPCVSFCGLPLAISSIAGVRVIPGSYLARPQDDGFNPGAGYIRLALVSDSESTAEALHRLVETLG